MIGVWVQQVTGTKRKVLLKDDEPVVSIRRTVAQELQLPEARLKLVHKGQTLQDWTRPAIANEDTLLAFVAPVMPTTTFSQRVAAGGACDCEEADEVFRLPANAHPFKRAIARFLQRRLYIPDVILQLLFAIKPSVFIGIFVWFMFAPVAAKFEVGPLYVLATILATILMNLGSRKAGEMSAYSIFNEGQQQLPGQLNADAIDQQIRAGNI